MEGRGRDRTRCSLLFCHRLGRIKLRRAGGVGAGTGGGLWLTVACWSVWRIFRILRDYVRFHMPVYARSPDADGHRRLVGEAAQQFTGPCPPADPART